MNRFIFSILIVLCITQISKAQTQNIKELYFDFLQVRTEPFKIDEALSKATELLKRSDELNAKQIASLTYHVGRLYEADDDMENAIPYYEKSIKLSPNYYVTYRALGFWYFKEFVDLGQKLSRIDKAENPPLYAETDTQYKRLALKTVAYLEKAQACDPDEETMSMIIDLYKAIPDPNGLKTLNTRLIALSKHCITLLDDE